MIQPGGVDRSDNNILYIIFTIELKEYKIFERNNLDSILVMV